MTDLPTRRRFVQAVGLASLGLLAGCGRLLGQAPQGPAPVPRIGVLSTAAPGDLTNHALRQGLQDLGYIEGQTIQLEWRFPSKLDEYPALAAELMQLPVAILVTQGSAASRAAAQASATTPIVMAFASDPVRAGLIATLAHPGGNVTGLASLTAELSGKRLELLAASSPYLARAVMLWNPAIAERAHEFEETAVAARTLGIDLQSVEVSDDRDLENGLRAVLQRRAEALVVQDSPLLDRYRPQISRFAAENGLPAMAHRKEFVAAGGLMSYGPKFADMNRRAGYYVDRILKGAKPADLPVEQPREFDFVINLKTAQTLGVTIPHHILLQATEVIQ